MSHLHLGHESSPETATKFAFHLLLENYASQRQHTLGRYLTFLDALFDESPRLKALKDTFKDLFYTNSDQENKMIASTFAGLARAIGDRETSNFIEETYGVGSQAIPSCDQYLEGMRPVESSSSDPQ